LAAQAEAPLGLAEPWITKDAAGWITPWAWAPLKVLRCRGEVNEHGLVLLNGLNGSRNRRANADSPLLLVARRHLRGPGGLPLHYGRRYGTTH
jgi:hypothetical protein